MHKENGSYEKNVQAKPWVEKEKENISIAQCIQILNNTTSKHLNDEYNEVQVKAWAFFNLCEDKFSSPLKMSIKRRLL
jgi:hypothetical protein